MTLATGNRGDMYLYDSAAIKGITYEMGIIIENAVRDVDPIFPSWRSNKENLKSRSL